MTSQITFIAVPKSEQLVFPTTILVLLMDGVKNRCSYVARIVPFQANKVSFYDTIPEFSSAKV